MWTLGIFVLSCRQFKKENLLHLASPPLVGLYFALAAIILLHYLNITKESWISDNGIFALAFTAVSTMGKATIPLAMTVAGARLASIMFADVSNRIVWGLSLVRLIVIPLAAILILKQLPIPDLHFQIMALVALMPVSINSMVLNEIYGGDKSLINGSVLLTHFLAILTIPTLLILFT